MPYLRRVTLSAGAKYVNDVTAAVRRQVQPSGCVASGRPYGKQPRLGGAGVLRNLALGFNDLRTERATVERDLRICQHFPKEVLFDRWGAEGRISQVMQRFRFGS